MAAYRMHRRLTTALLATLGGATLLIAACTTAAPAAPNDAMMPKTDAQTKPADTTTGKDAAMPSTTADTMKKDDAMMPKTDAMTKSGDTMMSNGLPRETVAAHFTASTPAHGATLTQAPSEIVLNFNFTLHEISTVTVTRNGSPVTTGPLAFGDRKLSLRAPLTGGVGEGLYVVTYKACWPDQSCHDGQFGFIVGAMMSKAQ